MSSGNYSQDFSNISGWSNNYASGTGASNWRVATSVVTSTVDATTVFSTGTTGGIQKGTNSMVVLATGTNSTATDLLLDFTGRTAGTISLNWSKIVNTANVTPRTSDLKIQYSTNNGSSFTDLTGYTFPRITNDNSSESGSISSVSLPSALDNQSQVVIRFYVWNNGQTGGSGNRPKFNIDDITITSTSSGSTPVITSSLTSSVTYGASYTYNITATNSPTSYGATGLPAGLSVNTSSGAITGNPTAAPGVYPVTISATNGSGSDSKTLNITITAKPLTITGISISNKTYDATTAATISGTPSLVGVVGGDVVSVSGGSAVFTTKTVGNGKATTVSGYTLSGTHAANYSLTQPSGLTANVTAATLTVSGAAAQNKPYDGTTAATITGTLNGILGTDVVTLNGTGTFASPNVGTGIAVTSTSTLSGADAGNYTLTQPTGLTANITAAPSVLAAWDFNGYSAYGSSPQAATSTHSNVTVVGLTRGSGVGTTPTAAANAWGGTDWSTSSSSATAISTNDFVTFSITANTGYDVSLSSISAYNVRRSTAGPTTGLWQYQIGSGSFTDIGSAITWGSITSASGNPQTAIDLSGISALQNISSGTTVTFRIVNYNASGTGSWYLNDPNASSGNDFVVNGFVDVAAPAPAIAVTSQAHNSTYAYGNKVINTNTDQTFTITNSGNATLNISSINVAGAGFSLQGSAPTSVAASGSANFTVRFSPTAVTSYSGTVTINSDATPNAYVINLTGTGTYASASDVAENNTSYSSNIDYTQFQATPLVGNSVSGTVGVMKLQVRDGGFSNNDNDGQGTTLTRIKFTVKDPSNNNRISQIRHAVLATTGNSIFAVANITGTELDFQNVTGWAQTVAGSNANSSDFILRVSFNSTGIIDKTKLVFQVSGVEALTSGSGFAAANGGAPASNASELNNINRLVVTADRLAFTIQPQNGGVGSALASFTVAATDVNENVDVDATNTFTLTTSSGSNFTSGSPYTLAAGIKNITDVVYSAAKTNETLTATNTGASLTFSNTATSSPFNVSNVAIGTYRSASAGNWTSISWERFTAGGWASSSAPTDGTTDSILIYHNVTFNTTGSWSLTKLVVMSSGTFTQSNTNGVTFTTLILRNGGTFNMNNLTTISSSGGKFEMEANATFNANYSSNPYALNLFMGTEEFNPASNFVIKNVSSANFLTTESALSAFTQSGYSAYFGNLIIDYGGTGTFTLISGTLTGNLTHGNLEFKTVNGNMRMIQNVNVGTSGSPVTIGGDLIINNTFGSAISIRNDAGNAYFRVKGNVVNNSSNNFRFFAGTNETGTIVLTVDGNLSINSGNFYFHSTSGTAPAMTLNLNGNLTVASGSVFSSLVNGSTATVNFTGNGVSTSTPQTIDIATTATTENQNIAFVVTNGAYVQQVNRDVELGVNSSLTVQSGGVYDFGYNGTAGYNLTKTASASSTSFNVNAGGTIRITSTESAGAIRSGTTNGGNVRTDSRTYNASAIYHYIGKANQFTGDALPTPLTGSLIVELNADALELSVNTTSRSVNSPGSLVIKKGTLLENSSSSHIDGTGTLEMTGGIYQIATVNTGSTQLPRISGSYTLNGGTVELNGNATSSSLIQNLRGAGREYYNLKISGTATGGGYKTIQSNAVVKNQLEITGNTIFDIGSNSLSGNGGVKMDGGRFRISRTTGIPALPELNGTATPYNLTGGVIELYGSTASNRHNLRGTYGSPSTSMEYYDVEINADAANEANGNAGTTASFKLKNSLVVNAPAILRLDRTDIVTNATGFTASFTVASGAGLFYGNENGITASGASGNMQVANRTFNTGTYGFVSTAANMVTGSGLPATVNKLFLLKSNAADQVSLTNSVTVNNAVGFTNGILTLGTRTLTFGSSATSSGASVNSFIATDGSGQVKKDIDAGASSFTFPVGDVAGTTEFSPATISFTSNAVAGTLGIKVTDAVHPNIGSSTNYISRYWSFTNTGLTNYSYSGSFNYTSADVVGNTNLYSAERWSGSAWVTAIGSSAAGNILSITGTQTQTSSPLAGDYTARYVPGPSVWVGTTPDWSVSTNWQPVGIPDNCNADVQIPANPVGGNYPEVSSAVSVGDLQLGNGARITLNNKLKVCGNITGGNSSTNLPAIIGTSYLELNGGSAQTISGRVQFNTLRLNNTNGTQLASGAFADIITALELQHGTFTTTGGTLTFKSAADDEYAILDNFSDNSWDGVLAGNAKVERYVPVAGFNQHYFGTPIVNATFAQLGATGTAGYLIPKPNCDKNQMANNSPYGTVFQWHDNDPDIALTGCLYHGWEVKKTGVTEAGRGYSVYLNQGVFSITGNINQGTSYSVGGFDNVGWATNNLQTAGMVPPAFNSGWHIVANPFLAPLELGGHDADFDDAAIWVTSGPYNGTYQPLAITGGNVAPMQGFIVHRNGASAKTFTFNKNECRTTQGLQFYKTASEHTLNIKVSGNGFNDITYIEYNSDATNAFDVNYDSRKLLSSWGQPTIFTNNSDGITRLSRNTNRTITETPNIPLNFLPGTGGSYTFDFEGINTFDPTTYMFIEDKQTGVWTDIRQNPVYTFQSNAGDAIERFVLHFTPAAIINTTAATCQTNGTLYLEQPGTANWNYTIANSQSNIINAGMLNNSNTIILGVPAGTYTITLIDNSGYTVVKAVTVSGVSPITANISASSQTAEVGEGITFSSNANAASTEWDMGDGVIYNTSQVTHQYLQEGTYTVTLTITSNDGCVSTATQLITVTEAQTTGVSNNTQSGINIFSFRNTVVVDFGKASNINATIDVYNIMGQLLLSDRTQNKVYAKEINNLSAAYIIIRVNNNGEETRRKLFLTGGE
ncbi:MAG: putative Ig domain-containing protein [Chitinophagales bacterium]|nr:putative Ig domain-containing protein [Chitinophagales bacterium]